MPSWLVQKNLQFNGSIWLVWGTATSPLHVGANRSLPGEMVLHIDGECVVCPVECLEPYIAHSTSISMQRMHFSMQRTFKHAEGSLSAGGLRPVTLSFTEP